MPSWSLPDARRIRSYIFRLPLATRGLLLAITGFYIATFFAPWLIQWGALIPQEINLNTLYRLNTFPLLHRNLLHYTLNLASLTPLLDRFESDHGTIVTILLFTGPFGLLPGGLYTLLTRYILPSPLAPALTTGILGSSIWVFLLLSHETLKTSRTNPAFTIAGYAIPTWTSPLALILVLAFLIPSTSFLGHLCGALVGYLWGLGYIRFLAPPDKVLRWVEGKLDLLGRLPHYVSVDQKTYGRYGVLPSTNGIGERGAGPGRGTLGAANGVAIGPVGSTQRLGT